MVRLSKHGTVRHLIAFIALCLGVATIAPASVSVTTGQGGSQERGDAESLEREFRSAHRVTSHPNRTAEEIAGAATAGQKTGQDHIFVFVGHGAENTNPRGALVGSDGRGVSGARLATALKCQPPNRTLVVLDSCWSADTAAAAAAACCTVLTSGSAGQKAAGKPPYTLSRAISTGLSGAADSNADGTVTLGEMTAYLKTNYDTPAASHYCNCQEKGTCDMVLSRYMKYDVLNSVLASRYDPDDPDPEDDVPITTGDELRNCDYIRVKQGGTITVRTKSGCENTYTLPAGRYHLGVWSSNPGAANFVECMEGEVWIEEAGDCEDDGHCGTITLSAEAYPAFSLGDPAAITSFSTAYDVNTFETTVFNSPTSFAPIEVIPLSGPDPAPMLVFPGEAVVVPYVWYAEQDDDEDGDDEQDDGRDVQPEADRPGTANRAFRR